MDHLACFVPGMLALSATTGAVSASRASAHMALADELLDTCCAFYAATPTGLAPEIVEFHATGGVEFGSKPQDQHSLLRPETVESLFLMWRLTHDPKWRAQGWAIFEALRTHARLPTG